MHAGADTDEAKTVEERLDHRSKLRLMSQFMAGVATYILARIAAILLPLFFVNQPGQARALEACPATIYRTVACRKLIHVCQDVLSQQCTQVCLMGSPGFPASAALKL